MLDFSYRLSSSWSPWLVINNQWSKLTCQSAKDIKTDGKKSIKQLAINIYWQA